MHLWICPAKTKNNNEKQRTKSLHLDLWSRRRRRELQGGWMEVANKAHKIQFLFPPKGLKFKCVCVTGFQKLWFVVCSVIHSVTYIFIGVCKCLYVCSYIVCHKSVHTSIDCFRIIFFLLQIMWTSCSFLFILKHLTYVI